MNNAFLVKMVRAKQLELEAFGELLPEEVKNRMDYFKAGAKEFIKECAVELYLAGADSRRNREHMDNINNTHVKKVTIQ